MKDEKLKVGEKLFNYILMILGIFAVYGASKISGIIPKTDSPGALPLFIAFSLCAFSLWIYGENRTFSPIHFNTYKERQKAFKELVFPNDILIMVVLLIIYSIGLDVIGFNISTFAFLWISMIYLTAGNWLKNLGYTAISLGFILIIFKFLFKVILP